MSKKQANVDAINQIIKALAKSGNLENLGTGSGEFRWIKSVIAWIIMVTLIGIAIVTWL